MSVVMRVFLECDGFRTSSSVSEMYSLFTYEALHNLSFGISNMMADCQFTYHSSEGVVMGQCKAALMGWNLLLSANHNIRDRPMLSIYSGKWDLPSDLNGLYKNNRTQSILEGN